MTFLYNSQSYQVGPLQADSSLSLEMKEKELKREKPMEANSRRSSELSLKSVNANSNDNN